MFLLKVFPFAFRILNSVFVVCLQVLVDAVLFGVIPIVYEYEGTTIESLLSQVETCLNGRAAQ